MKKILLLLLSFTLLLLTGCAQTTTEDPNIKKYEDITITDDVYRNYYEIFVASFYDSDGDGLGDLNGVTEKLDYIKELGYNGIWLMPTTSAYSYHKYDVLDYYKVDSDFGTNDDMKNLLDECHKRGINVLMDLVVNHTSNYHKWFIQATDYIKKYGEPGGDYGDYYNFITTAKSGYSKVSGTNYYYECRFYTGMPDLNLDSENVRNEIKDIMKFWLDMGFDGFRLDATTSYYTDDETKSIEFLSFLNTEAKKIKSNAYLVGEAWLSSDVLIENYYDSGIDSFFTFPLAQGTGSLMEALRENASNNGALFGNIIKSMQNTYKDNIMAPFLSNHDTTRVASFVGKSKPDKIKMIQGLLSLINGALFTYYGEEIGMLSYANNNDPSKRLPMYWSSSDTYTGKVTTTPENIVLKDGTYYFQSLEDQVKDPDSIYNYYKYSIYIRNANPEIARGTNVIHGEYQSAYPYCLVLEKQYNGKSIYIVINLNRTESFDVNLGTSLGFTSMTQELCATATNHVTYDSATHIVSLPPYSYCIFR